MINSAVCGATTDFEITNILKDKYGGFSKNWSIDFDDKGAIYIGNEAGLLVFDGRTWNLHKVTGNETVRSVYVDGERVYTGSFEQFGYWEPNMQGQLSYTSLSTDLASKDLHNDMIWKIIPDNLGGIIFQSFNTLYHYNGTEVKVQQVGFGIIFLLKVRDRIIAQKTRGNLLEYKDGVFTEIPGSAFLNKAYARVFLPYRENEYVIGSGNKGLFIWNPELGFREWRCEAQKVLKKYNINSGDFDGTHYYIGTLDNGVFVLNLKGEIINHFNVNQGLEGNSALDTKCDKYGRLWLALNRGLACIGFNSPILHITSRNAHLGIVQSIEHYDDKLYLATNQGVFFHLMNDNDFKNVSLKDFTQISDLKGQAWKLKKEGEQLICSHNKGTYEIEGDRVTQLTEMGGGINFIPITINGDDYLLENTYTSLILLKKEKNRYVFHRMLKGFFEPSRNMEIDQQNNIWVSHARRKEVFRVTIEDINKPLKKVRYGKMKGLPQNYGNKVCKLDGRIVFTTPDGLYTYDELRDTVVRYHKIEKQLEEYAMANSIVKTSYNSYWFALPPKAALFEVQEDSIKKVFEYTFSDPFSSLDEKHPVILGLNDSITAFCLENGFAIFNKSSYTYLNKKQDSIYLKNVLYRDGQQMQRLLNLDNSSISTIPFANNRVVFEYMSMSNLDNKTKYWHKLEGYNDKWITANPRNRAAYQNLSWGSYKFIVSGEDEYGNALVPISYHFEVDKPYFVKVWFIVLISILSLAVLVLLRKFITLLIRRNRARMIDKEKNEWDKKHVLERTMQDEKMTRLKNELLQKEIQHQSTELANRTIATIKRKDVLNEVKAEIIKQQDHLKVSYPEKYMKRIIRMIDHSIEDEDDWKVFRSHFDRAHEDFFKRMKQDFEELTPKDLRLCAYLKMNLSTKEIAPLMNVSPRSVEVHRYKVRKKLGLDHNDNLTEFMISY